jgi:hypothetical protein
VQRAKRKCGKDSFCLVILATTESKHEADHLEKFYIALFKTLTPNGYNIALGGDGGAIHTEEMKKLISLKLKGRPSHRKGTKTPQSVCQKISEGLYRAGFRHSNDHKEKMSVRFKGRIMSDETKKKMSESAKRRANTPEGLARMKRASLKAFEISGEIT